MRIHHVQVACPVGGEDDARAFYADALGMTEVEKPDELRGRGGAWFRDIRDGAIVAELHVGVESPFAPARKAHPAFVFDSVVELDEVRARVVSAGFTVDDGERTSFPGYLRVHAFDGAGNRVELLAPVGS